MGLVNNGLVSANGFVPSQELGMTKLAFRSKLVGVNLWTPEELTTAAWYDATDSASIISSSNRVSQWNDLSGNGYNLIQSAAFRQPQTGQESINGLNTINFEGGNERIDTTATGSDNWQDVYIMTQTIGFASGFTSFNGLVSGRGAAGSEAGILGSADANNMLQGWWDDTYLNGTLLPSPYTVLPTIQDDASIMSIATNSAISVDGLNVGSERFNPDRTWLGKVGEVIAFNSVLSTDDRQLIEGYLAHKWGTTASLPISHPYKDEPPIIE